MDKKLLTKGAEQLAKRDAILKELIGRVGPCRIANSDLYFSSLVKTIISQQLSKKAADTIHNRLILLAGNKIEPKQLNAIPVNTLRTAGISLQKANYLKELSNQFLNNPLEDFSELSDIEVIGRLTQFNGIGIWSAQMFLIFTLGRPDVLPLQDVGLKNSIDYHYKGTPLEEDCIEKYGTRWTPYSSIACWYLWKAYDMR